MKSKNLLFIFFMTLLVILQTGCGNVQIDIEKTLTHPEGINIAVEGTWKIEGYIPKLPDNTAIPSNLEPLIGMSAIFDKDIAAVGNDISINPSYKLIWASANTYVHNKFRINADSIGITEDNINVVYVTSDNQLSYELLLIDNSTLYVCVDKGFLQLKKVASDIDEQLKRDSLQKGTIKTDSTQYTEDPLLRTSIMLGIRSADNTYRTILMHSKNREVKYLEYTQQLIVPRLNGFWELGSLKFNDNEYKMYAKQYSDQNYNAVLPQDNNYVIETKPRKILYAASDYVSTESDSKLKVLHMDNLVSTNGAVLSEFIINNPANILKQSSQALISSLNKEQAKLIDSNPQSDAFKLERRNGHWLIRGRLYYTEKYKEKEYEDYDINVMVPKKLLSYDEMSVPWSEIKGNMPWVTDAFCSPNNDISLLVTQDNIRVYPIKNGKVVNSKLLDIPLNKGDTIVMAEWAIGKYADIWAEFAKSNFAAE